MSVEVRPIQPDELEAWVTVLYTAFHANRPPAEGAAYRRDVLGQDFPRTLAGVEDGRIVGTYESFGAELTLPGGGCVPTDAISGVTVLPTHHRRGVLTQMITDDLYAARDRGEVAAILLPSEYPIYGRFGFGPATERAEYTLDRGKAHFKQAASGSVSIVAPGELANIAPAIFDQFRQLWPGQIDRQPSTWALRLGLDQSPWAPRDSVVRCLLYESPRGDVEGYATYRVEEERHNGVRYNTLQLSELVTLSASAYLALWRFCSEIDLIHQIQAQLRPVNEPVKWLLENPRVALQQTRRTDFLWVRPLDVPRLLAGRRYSARGKLVLEVSDPLPLCGGRYELDGGPDGADCRARDAEPDLSLSMTALGAIALGGVALSELHQTGLVRENQPGALAKAERMFCWPITPWCSTFF